MAIDIRQKEEEKGIIINFNKADHTVVEINGGYYVVHNVQAEKLIKAKKAKEVKGVDLIEPETNKSVKDIKTK